MSNRKMVTIRKLREMPRFHILVRVPISLCEKVLRCAYRLKISSGMMHKTMDRQTYIHTTSAWCGASKLPFMFHAGSLILKDFGGKRLGLAVCFEIQLV